MPSKVADATQRDLDTLPGTLAGSALAATALALARELDKPRNSATSKAMCARALSDVLSQLRALAPANREDDGLDDIAARRRARLAGGSAP